MCSCWHPRAPRACWSKILHAHKQLHPSRRSAACHLFHQRYAGTPELLGGADQLCSCSHTVARLFACMRVGGAQAYYARHCHLFQQCSSKVLGRLDSHQCRASKGRPARFYIHTLSALHLQSSRGSAALFTVLSTTATAAMASSRGPLRNLMMVSSSEIEEAARNMRDIDRDVKATSIGASADGYPCPKLLSSSHRLRPSMAAAKHRARARSAAVLGMRLLRESIGQW